MYSSGAVRFAGPLKKNRQDQHGDYGNHNGAGKKNGFVPENVEQIPYFLVVVIHSYTSLLSAYFFEIMKDLYDVGDLFV